MEIEYPVWLPKAFGSPQTPEEMNGLVQVLQNHAENLSKQQRQIMTSAGGIYPEKITPTSTLPDGISQAVFLVGPGTYTNFGNSVVPQNNLGLIFHNNSSFELSLIDIPAYDDTNLINRVANVESSNTQFQNNVNQRIDDLETEQQDFIESFSVEVDQEFNESSDNAIANKEVSKLADVLDGFWNGYSEVNHKLAYTIIQNTSPAINGVSVLTGSNLLKANNTTVNSQGINSIIYRNIPITYNNNKISKFIFNAARIGGVLNQNVNLLGIKSTGQIDVLIGSLTETPSRQIEVLEFDLSNYDYFSFMLHFDASISNNSERKVEIYKKETESYNVKERYDTALKSFVFQLELKEVLTIKQNTSPAINGVSALVGSNVLRATNTTSNFQGVNSIIYRNIPITYNNNKVTKFIFNSSRVGGDLNQNVNLLGIKSTGQIDVLIGSLNNPATGQIENLEFDLSNYDYFSFMISFSETAQNNSERKAEIYNNNILKFPKEDSVKEYIDERTRSVSEVDSRVLKETLICVDKSNTLPTLNVIGQLPTDISDERFPTEVELEYSVNNRIVFKAKSDLAVQGNATASFAKKGFECALTNYEDKELKVQFGDWIACSEFHIKAFPNDQTMTKDVASSRLWHQVRKSRPFPQSYIADFNTGQQEDKHKENLLHQALFYADGFPIELRLNGVFYGLYVFRLKKDRDNYMLNNANQNHVFLDNETIVDWTIFNPSNWKVRSPKISGYVDGGPIESPELMSKCNRWWAWFDGITKGTVDFESTASQYINIESWVDWLICQQLTAHWDSQVNNVLMTSWDGLRLSLVWYDGDQTFGWVTQSNAYMTIDSNGLYWRGTFFRNTMYPKLLSRIKTRYTELRSKGVISTDNIVNIINEVANKIPRDIYTKEFNSWDLSQPNVGKHNLRYIFNWTNQRISKLDSIWKVN